MAAGQANGRPAGSSHALGKHAAVPSKLKKKKGFVMWTFSNAARLTIWYAIITALFRCPATLEEVDDHTPKVCAPYLQTRIRLDPHLRPYYEQYVEPYTTAAKPYYDRFYQQVYTPAFEVAQTTYVKYGAPRVEAAQLYASEQWDKNIRPQLDVYGAQAKAQYDKSLAPHVEKVSPYYEQTRDSVQGIYNGQVLPAYEAVQPHVNVAVTQAQKHWIETGKPYSVWALNTSWGFVNRNVWPKIRILYGENVEPQVIRITERLGRYRDEQKLKAAVEEFEEPATPEDPEATHENPAHAVEAELADESSTAQSEATPPVETEEEKEARIRASIEDDLTKWQKSWEKASTRGIEDLQERVAGIAKKQTSSQIEGVGRALLTELEETISSEMSSFKSAIIDAVHALGEEPSDADVESGQETVGSAVRIAGKGIRIRAQTIRGWHQKFVSESHNLVAAAATSTLEVIDGIRDLGLQEIGMKWANLGDSVTYKDWARYHELKKDYSRTRKLIENAALDHPDYAKAKADAEDLESVGMAVAEDAAKELVRLKAVGIWKVESQDDTDDFSTKVIPPKARLAAKKVSEAIEAASESILGTSQGNVESVMSEASKSVESAASKISAKVAGTEPGVVEKVSKGISEAVIGTEEPAVVSAASAVKDSVASVAGRVEKMAQEQKVIVADEIADNIEAGKSALSEASKSIIGTSTPAYESAASNAASSVKSAVSQAKEAVVGSSTPVYESVASDVSKSAASAASVASEAVVGSETPAYESVASKVSSGVADAASSAESLVESVMSAASASSDSLQSAASEAIVGSATPAYESVISKASEKVVGSSTPIYESVASEVSSSAESVLSEASSAVIGSETPIYESAASEVSKKAKEGASSVSSAASKATKSASKVFAGAMAQAVEYNAPIMDEEFDELEYADQVSTAMELANSKYQQMTKAVSEALLKPSPTKGSVESIQKVIAERYATAMQAASEALYGKEPSVGEKIADAANSRYTDAVSAASSIFYGTPTPALESISAIAASRLADSISYASEQLANVRNVAAAAGPTPTDQNYLVEARKAYYQGVGLANERYSEFVSSASVAVYGTPTPLLQKRFEAYVSRGLKELDERASSASSRLSGMSEEIKTAAAAEKTDLQSTYDELKSHYDDSLRTGYSKLAEASEAAIKRMFGAQAGGAKSVASAASEKASSVVDAASTAIYGVQTPAFQSMAIQASANWQELVSKASEQIYGQPTPWYESAISQAGEYGAQASSQAVDQYAAITALIGQMVLGKEPAFTDSLMSRLSSAYYTGAPDAASSVSSAVAEGYSSAASVVSVAFVTPSARIDEVIDRANEQVAAALAIASAQIYGSQTGYAEQAQSSVSAAAERASSAISVAIYGTPTGVAEAATSKIAEAYSSASSAASGAASAASAKISEAVYGQEKSALESAQGRLAEAMESARASLSSMAASAGEGASEALSKASEAVENMASSVSSAASAATDKVKDEL